MAEEESFENLDDLDWSDVESELKANKDQILSEAKSGDGYEQKEGDSSGSDSRKDGDEGSKSKTPQSSEDIDIKFLFDVKLSIVVEVGRVQMLISDLLELDEE